MTRIALAPDSGRVRCDLSGGPLSPRLLRSDGTGARVALVATTALLLGGDDVTIDVSVGAGAWLEVVETAGTVAYPGPRATWGVRARLGPGAVLVWAGLPFVVCAGADVVRETSLDLADGARAVLRETTVLGRAGEGPGAIRSRMAVRHGGGELLTEDLVLDAAALAAPGILGGRRVIDTVAALGFRPGPEAPPGSTRGGAARDGGRAPASPGGPDGAGGRDGAGGPAATTGSPATAASVAQARRRRLDLAGPGALSRFIGTQAHASGLSADLELWTAAAYAR